MQDPQTLYRADIANRMPADLLDNVEETLVSTSRVMGMFEAWKAFSERDPEFEPINAHDEISVIILEDIHQRSASLVENADEVIDAGHTEGFFRLLALKVNEVRPDIDALRAEASSVIARGFNIEEDEPMFGDAGPLDIEQPFFEDSPEVSLDDDLAM